MLCQISNFNLKPYLFVSHLPLQSSSLHKNDYETFSNSHVKKKNDIDKRIHIKKEVVTYCIWLIHPKVYNFSHKAFSTIIHEYFKINLYFLLKVKVKFVQLFFTFYFFVLSILF